MNAAERGPTSESSVKHQRTSRHAVALALLLASTFPSCATVSMWGWVVEDIENSSGSTTTVTTHWPSAEQSIRTTPNGGGGAFAALIATPITLAWDLVTMPIQIARGDRPYGSKKS